jgi:thiamine monophosphate synthase
MLVRVAEALVGRPDVALQVRHKLDPAPRSFQHGRSAFKALSAVVEHLPVFWNTPRGAPALGFRGIHLSEDALRDRTEQPGGTRLSASVHCPRSLATALDAGVDFVVFGPVFDPASKPGVTGVGLSALEKIVRQSSVPVLALGGVTPDRVAACRAAGAWGVACVTPVVTIPNPSGVIRRYLSALCPIDHDQGVRQ